MSGIRARQLVQRQFGQNPQGYVHSASHAQGADLVQLLEGVQPQPGWRMLDVATGGGHTARTFAQHVARAVAGDLTFPMLRAAGEHLRDTGVVLCQLDAEALPFATNSFDLVTCRIAPHHFPDPGRFVQEAARVVRPEGIVAVVDQIVPRSRKAARYINAFERLRDPSHAWAYSLPRWEGFFQEAGLTVWRTERFEHRHSLGEWAARMGCSTAVVTRLRAMLVQAPEPVIEWLQPEVFATGDAVFSIHQAMILGRKTGV